VAASGGVEVVGQTIDDVVGVAQEPVEYVRRSATRVLGGVSNKPPLSMRHEGD